MRHEVESIRETAVTAPNSYAGLRYYSITFTCGTPYIPTRTEVVLMWAKDELDAMRLFRRDFANYGRSAKRA